MYLLILSTQTVGLVSPTPVPFTSTILGKTNFQITTSVGRCLQTYDLRRGLQLVFVTRPQTPGPITATASFGGQLLAAWATSGSQSTRGVWIFNRGKKVGQLRLPVELDEDIVQILQYGSWIVGCCSTRIEVWSSTTFEHYTTLMPPFSDNVLTGGICTMPTFTNKIFAGREDGSVEIWNVGTGKLIYRILPASSDTGPVSAIEPTPALSLLAIAYVNGHVTIHNVRTDQVLFRLNAGQGDQSPITTISFRKDNYGAGDDGRQSGVMATASMNSGDVTLWDLNDGGRRMGLLRAAHSRPTFAEGEIDGGVSKIEFLPSQPVLVSSGADNTLRSWIFDQTPFSPIPRPLHLRSGHAAPITTLNFLPSDADGADAGGKWLLSTSRDRSLWGWSLRRDGQSTELSQGKIQKKAKKLGIMTNGNMSQTENLDELKASEITCLACSLNRDGGIGAMPGVNILWANAKQLKGKSTATEQNPTGWESVITGHKGDRFARTWYWGRKRAGRWVLETTDGGEVTAVAISPCGTFALIGSATGAIDMFNLQSGNHRQRFPSPLTRAEAKRAEVEKDKAVVPSNDLNIPRKWAKGYGRHTNSITGIHVDNLNRIVTSSSLDGKIKFWDFMTGQLLHELNWNSQCTILKMKCHRPTGLIALSCSDSCLRIIDLETRKVVRELSGIRDNINDFCFSNDGRWVVAASSDSIIRVWDLPTGNLIDAMRLQSQCIALDFSNTGEYLATALENSVGVEVWTNKTLFKHIPTKQIKEDDVAIVVTPSASGEGGQTIISSAFDDQDEEGTITDEVDYSTISVEQLSKDITTLSMVPKSRWQTLLHLDLIRERNKPKEPPKAPEKAPFFLPTLANGKSNTNTSLLPQESDTTTTDSERSRLLKMSRDATSSRFTSLLHSSNMSKDFEPLVEHLKTLPPAAADIEIRSLQASPPYTEPIGFVYALTKRLRAKRDYELVQAWMAVFLRCHGEVITENASLMDAVRNWRVEQKRESDRLNKLAGYCAGVVGYLRGAM